MGREFDNLEPVEPAKITPEGKRIADEMKGKLDGAAGVIDDLVAFFGEPLGLDGKGLYDVVILPLSGDFNRISANGRAWEDTGKMIRVLLKNLQQDAKILITRDWTGDAANAFFTTVDVGWLLGMGAVATCCDFMKKGFDKVAAFATENAERCATIFNDVINRLVKLATKAVPVGGQLWELAEWLASGFDWKEFPYVGEIYQIGALIHDIKTLHDELRNAIEKIKQFFEISTRPSRSSRKSPTPSTRPWATSNPGRASSRTWSRNVKRNSKRSAERHACCQARR